MSKRRKFLALECKTKKIFRAPISIYSDVYIKKLYVLTVFVNWHLQYLKYQIGSLNDVLYEREYLTLIDDDQKHG